MVIEVRQDRLASEEHERVRALERENRELRKANEILEAASAFSPRSLTGRPEVSAFIEERKAAGFAVELVGGALGVSASAYYQRARGQRSRRAVEDDRLLERIREVHQGNYFADGSRRVRNASGRVNPRDRAGSGWRDGGRGGGTASGATCCSGSD